MDKRPDAMSMQELQVELKRLKDSLCDIEDQHAFTFGRTSVHIGAEKAQNMQLEYEEECRAHRERIAEIEQVLAKRSGAKEG
jgi:ribosomal protein L29